MQKYGGVSRCFIENIINSPDNIQPIIGMMFSENEYHNTYYPKSIFLNKKNTFRGKRTFFLYLGKIISIFHMLIEDYDILHVTGDNTYFLKYNKKPFVITIHDMIPELLYNKENWISKNWINRRKEIIYKSHLIIAVSQNTKNDLLKIYPDISEQKIKVIYHGIGKSPHKRIENKWGEYILFVGGRDSYKNYKLFISATSNILHKNKNLKIICTGKSFSTKEHNLHKELDIQKQVIQISANDIELDNLYQNAKLFIYPSKYEGFGIPILEAWKNKCPIAISNTSSFPEIAQNAAVYFNPNDKNSIKDAIEQLLQDSKKKKELIILGFERLEKFSWKESAKKLFAAYNTIKEIK